MITKRKGIILAGGNGTRLFPLTSSISKQLLAVYDKPMIYYPLSTLMLSGIKDILIICKSNDISIYKKLLGNGESLGIRIEYEIQKKPSGIAEAFLIGEDFLDGHPSVLILGDNLFYGQDLSNILQSANNDLKANTLFGYQVKDPKRYGVMEFDKNFNLIDIREKPKKPKSNFAVTGIYFYDEDVVNLSKQLKPSKRNELEISDLNCLYIKEKNIKVKIFGRGVAWLDTGTFDSLLDAGIFIKTIENRQGLKIGCPEEIAWRMGFINNNQLLKTSEKLPKNSYRLYLENLIPNQF